MAVTTPQPEANRPDHDAYERGVSPFVRDELLVGADLDEAAVVDHRDQVGALRGGEPVRDDDHAAPGHEPLERPVEQQLGTGIEARRGFVEHEHRRVDEPGARHRHELAFARREVRAARVDLRVEALREVVEPLGEAEVVERGADARVVGIGRRHQQVLADRAGEQEALLGDDDDPPAQRGLVDVAEVDATEADRAVGRVVEPRHQLGERRLARAGGADEHEPLAVLERERHVVQHRIELRRVPEAHVVDHEIAGDRELDRLLGLDEIALLVEQAVELLQRRGRLLERVEHLRELLDRLEQVVEVEHERGDDADGHVALGREVRAEPDDQRERHALHQLDDRHVDRGDALGADAGEVLLAARVGEVPDGAVGLVEKIFSTTLDSRPM